MILKIAAFFSFLAFDVVSKVVALRFIPLMAQGSYPYGGVGVFANFLGISFSLNTVFNSGAAWGLFQGHSGLLFGFRVVVILSLILYLLFFHRGATPKFPLWLVVLGAVGNALDYALYGRVIDLFHFVFWGYSFPVFNLADAYITLGVLGLFFFPEKKTAERPAPP